MRQIAGAIALLAVALLAGHAAGWFRNPEGSRVWSRILLPYHMVRLQAADPDGTLAMPVKGAEASKVARTWHAPRPGGRRHEGADIFAPRGTPVLSATRGVVMRVSENRLGGNIVTVFGPGGRTYYYAHLDAYASGLATGNVVQPGEVLGYVGNTGNARTTPPHLHFGVYGLGGAIDPLPMLTGHAPDLKRSSSST